MAQLKDTVVNGTLTATTIKRSDGSSNILKGDGSTIALGTDKETVAKGDHTHDDRYYTESEINTKLSGKSNTDHTHDDRYYTESEINTKLSGKSNTDHNHTHDDLTGLFPWMRKSITLDSIVLDGTTFKNVEFENVGNGIFLSKNILKGIYMDRLGADSLLDGSSTNDVGNGNIGKAAATSIEASLRRQFGDSVSLKTYVRTYDGTIHSEKVFLPLECEVHGSIKYSADKDTLGKYQQWSIPNNKIKTGNNGYWWCANKSSYPEYFCAVTSDGSQDHIYSNYDPGVALAFYL